MPSRYGDGVAAQQSRLAGPLHRHPEASHGGVLRLRRAAPRPRDLQQAPLCPHRGPGHLLRPATRGELTCRGLVYVLHFSVFLLLEEGTYTYSYGKLKGCQQEIVDSGFW